jgi:tetratricopeptide (TPR) repeat protein
MKHMAMIGVLLLVAVIGLSRGQQTEERFDSLVRADFFAGYAGDAARLERGMQTCEKTLANDPRNGAALVWHGGGLFFQSGLAFARGDRAKGIELKQRGLKEMDDAVALWPESLQTRIPRGAMLISTGRYMDDASARPLIEKGVADYEKALSLEKLYFNFDGMSVHSKGELMGGLADGYRRLGDTEKSRELLQRIVAELPNSVYDTQARRWLNDLSAVGKQERFCLGCHVSSNP